MNSLSVLIFTFFLHLFLANGSWTVRRAFLRHTLYIIIFLSFLWPFVICPFPLVKCYSYFFCVASYLSSNCPSVKDVYTDLDLLMVIEQVCNFLVGLFFLELVEKFGVAPVYGSFGAFSLMAAAFAYYFIVETKGRSLEEIEMSLNPNFQGKRNSE